MNTKEWNTLLESKTENFWTNNKTNESIEPNTIDVLEQKQNLIDLVPVVNKFDNMLFPESNHDEDEQFQLPSSTPFKLITDKP